MREDIENLLQAAFDETLDFTGDAFTYKAKTYYGVISEVEIYTELKEGGMQEVLATVVVVSKKALRTKPVTGETLLISGKPVRIHKVSDDLICFTVTCITATK